MDGTIALQRDRWQGPRLTDAQIRALSGRELSPPAAGPRAGAPVAGAAYELALLAQNVPWHRPMPAALELSGRGYARAPVGPTALAGTDPTLRWNTLEIRWPQALANWGTALFIGMLEPGVDVVLGTAPVTTPPFAVAAGDQPRIPAHALRVAGAGINQRRPFGTGRYSESLFSGYPPGGDVFWIALDQLDYAWGRQANTCGAWAAMPPLISGGCACG